MCGRMDMTYDEHVQKIYYQLQIARMLDEPVNSRFVRATDKVSIVRQKQGERFVQSATWWLLLEAQQDGFKPSRYTSFNTRYDKLNVPRSAGFQPFRQSRCILVAKGFGETEFKNKKPIHYHDLQGQDGPLLLGGLCRDWHHPQTGQWHTSCSVITLPPHPKLKHIHSKAMPLILPKEDGVVNDWLSDAVTDVERFSPLLRPHIPENLVAQQIDKPSTFVPISKPHVIDADLYQSH